MVTLLNSAVQTVGMVSFGGVELEAVIMYGLVVLVVGMIAWSKYNEPPLSDPYPTGKPGQDFPATSNHGALGPVATVAPTDGPPAARERQ
jgi:hypothetical protein